MLTKRETPRLIAEGGINQEPIIYDREIVNRFLGYEQFRLSPAQVNLKYSKRQRAEGRRDAY